MGTTVEARDQFEAITRIRKRYPDCAVLSLQQIDAELGSGQGDEDGPDACHDSDPADLARK